MLIGLIKKVINVKTSFGYCTYVILCKFTTSNLLYMRYTFRLFQLIIIFLFTEGNIYAEQTFERGFGTPYDDVGLAVCHTGNTGFVVGGKTNGYTVGTDYDFYFVKFNLAGNVIWHSHIGTAFDDEISGIVEYNGGELYAIGTSYNSMNTHSRIMLTKLSALGAILWSKEIGDTLAITKANELIILPNGNIAICGMRSGVGASAIILQTDTSGNLLFSKSYATNSYAEFTDLIETNDGNIAACTATKIGNQNFISVYKFDLSCDTIWSYTSSSFSALYFNVTSLVQGNSGQIYIGGSIWVPWFHGFYHVISESGTFIKHVNSGALISDKVNDLAIDRYWERISAADSYENFASHFCIQDFDTSNTSVLGNFRFLESDIYSFNHANTVTSAFAIDQKPSPPVNGSYTIVGGTIISNYGNLDLAIVHTDRALVTSSKTQRPVISAKTPVRICPGDSVLISLDSLGRGIHRWANFRYPPQMDLGESSDSIWVKENGFYEYIGLNQDSTIWISNQIQVTVIDTPDLAISASDPLNYCLASGDHLNFSVTQQSGCRYQWFLNNTPLLNDTLISVNANSTGEYFCQISNQCNAFNTDTFTVNSAAIPPVQINTSNADMWVNTWCNTSGIMYFEINEVTGANYQWLLNGIPILGSTLRVCDILVQGDYSCIVSDSCGIDTSITYTVYDAPYPKPGVFSNQQLCSALDSINLWPNVPDLLLSQWYFNGSPIAGATGQFYNAKQPGNYSFDFITYQCSNSTMRSSISTITSGTTPPFDLGNDTLICHNETLLLDATTSNIYYYYWNTGATTSSIIASSGVVDTVDYFLRVTWSNYCISYDTITIVFDVCTEIEDAITEHIKLYPTTTHDQLTLEIPENNTCIVKIIDPLGKMVYEKPTNENNIQLDVSELSMGIYLLYIERNNKRSPVFKFIKTN